MKTPITIICDDDGENFVCLGTLDKRKALKEIRKFQINECGLDREYLATLDDLRLTPVWEDKSPSENETWTYWDDKPSIYAKYLGSAYRYTIN